MGTSAIYDNPSDESEQLLMGRSLSISVTIFRFAVTAEVAGSSNDKH
jgi:hypothetical protein